MGCLCTCFMLMLILIQKRNINGNVNVIFSFYVFLFFFSSFIHFLISTTRRFYVFRSSTFKNETNSCQFQFIRVINTPSITSTSQRHLYFLQSRIPSFTNQQKKKKIITTAIWCPKHHSTYLSSTYRFYVVLLPAPKTTITLLPKIHLLCDLHLLPSLHRAHYNM